MKKTFALRLLTVTAAAVAAFGPAPAVLAAPPTQHITFTPESLDLQAGTGGRITATVTNTATTSQQIFAVVAVIPPTGVTLADGDVSISWYSGSGSPVPLLFFSDPHGTLPNARFALISSDGVNRKVWTVPPQQAVSIPLVVGLGRAAPTGELLLGVAVSSTTVSGDDAVEFASVTVRPPAPASSTAAPTTAPPSPTSPAPQPTTTPPRTAAAVPPSTALRQAAGHLAHAATNHPAARNNQGAGLAATGPRAVLPLGILAALLVTAGVLLTRIARRRARPSPHGHS
jgi:hypothetical protein